MRPLFLVTVFLWAVIDHAATLAIHVLTYTHAEIDEAVSLSVAIADVLLLAVFACVIQRIQNDASAVAPAVPIPRWLDNLGGLMILFGVILIPYSIGNFLFLVFNHPTKRIPAYAEMRLLTGFGLVCTYAVVIVSGRALARCWWPGVRWIDASDTLRGQE